MNSDLFNIDSITDQLALLLQPSVIDLLDLGEPPHLRHENPLLSWEFMFTPPQSLHGNLHVLFLASDGKEWLSDGDSGGPFDGLPVGPSHSGLETIGPRAGEHLVDTDDVPGVHAAAHVEGVLPGVFGQVLVGRDTGGFQGVRGDLFSGIRH